MERRLFLAIGLSLFVVWLWSLTTPKPQLGSKAKQTPQHIGDKEDRISKNISRDLSPAPDSTPDTNNESLEHIGNIITLSSEKLSAEFSDIGASLKNIVINTYDASLPIRNITSISGYESALFNLEKSDESSVQYIYEDEYLRIRKSYVIKPGEYIIESFAEFYNKAEMSKKINVDIGSYTIEMSSLDNKHNESDPSFNRDKSLFEYVINASGAIKRKAGAFKFSEKEKGEEFQKVLWVGFRDRYFCTLIKPQYDTKGYTINAIDERRLQVRIKSEDITIDPKSRARFDSTIYTGPEKIDILKQYGHGFEKIKRYYRFALFDGIAKIIESFMHLIYKLVPNWGICIIITSTVIYFSMYPLTMRGMLSMRKMQTIQPMIAKIKEKHKDNNQKMNKEMMELYKENKINPLGGCLPMVLQMPVFIGLYQVLWRSVSFKGAHFLWIKDLSQPDRLFVFPFNIPFLGNEFNLLPIVMIVVMYFQQKITAKNIIVTDPAQVAQQKMMSTIMPVFLGVIFYKFASGLTLYFTMFYFFSTFTQLKMSKVTGVR